MPIEEMINEFEERRILEVLQGWKIKEANQLPAVHTALAKIYFLKNKDPQQFPVQNTFYDCTK